MRPANDNAPNGVPLPSGGPRGQWAPMGGIDWAARWKALREDPDTQNRLARRRAEQQAERAVDYERRQLEKEARRTEQYRKPEQYRPANAAVALGNIASNALRIFSAESGGQCHTFSPFRLQAEMRAAGLLHERSRRCRMRRLSDRVQVTVDERGTPSVTGCETCGSVWDCPCCATRIMHDRAEQLTYACNWWRQEKQGKVYLLTLTVRHQFGTELGTLFTGVANAFRSLTSASFAAWRANVSHSVRAIEVTHGANGWHPHLHVLLFTEGELEQGFIEQLQARWQSCVAAHLGDMAVPQSAIGCDVRSGGEAARYLQKMGLEVASIATKEASLANRTPWQLARAALAGDRSARSAWAEYVSGTYGKKQLTWSRKLRTECKQLQEWDDYLEKLNGADDKTQVAFVADIEGTRWEALCRNLAWVRRFTDAARAQDFDALRVLFAVDSNGRTLERAPPYV